MEDNKRTITNMQGKRKIHPLISIGGEGGIAGLFVFGGALAIAGFMAVASFAVTNKDKDKDKHKPKPKPKPTPTPTHDHQSKPKPKPHACSKNINEEDHDPDTTQTLTSLIQHSTIQHGDATCYAATCWTSNMSIKQANDSSELVSAEALVLEEKRDVEESPTGFNHQEIVFSDSSHPASAASSNEGGVAEEFMVMSDQAQEGEKDDLITTEEEDDDMLSDDVSETSSKARGSASHNYNEEPVLPAELIQRGKHKYKGQDHLCTDSDLDHSHATELPNPPTFNQNLNLNFLMVPYHQPLTWFFPLLLLALLMLLVLLTHRPQESFYVLDEGNSVVKPI
ncbi:hypothetical protein VNO78_18079 [Psophocarpus tetragonolobus]|uniref:Uncharacterized protein n=1 Tax=Psophocarpus tetragonolobus TaxID=3891 RepID=A0AAN9SI46_PSOTE